MILFLFSMAVVFSQKEITVTETELVRLAPQVDDPDNDQLQFTYTPPLNSEGEWQTTYGDAGVYDLTITVSDGTNTVSQDVRLTVLKLEQAPSIVSFSPEADGVFIEESQDVSFQVAAEDPNKDPLSYRWTLNNELVSESDGYTFESGFDSAGEYTLHVEVSDGEQKAEHSWKVTVENVDREGLLDKIPDIEVEENTPVRLDLPDFSAYGLTYTISDPIGDDNEWLPAYGGQGDYFVTVAVRGEDFEDSRKVKVTILKNDRAPVFEPVGRIRLREDQKVTLFLNATDPDGDSVVFSLRNGSSNAELEGNRFTWVPGYEAVQKDTFVNKLAAKYHLLSKDFVFAFEASSGSASAFVDVIITVDDVNRPPVIGAVGPMVVKEGDPVLLEPVAYDPDNDSITLSYSGWKNSASFSTSYGDDGNRIVTMTATDGFLFASRDVSVVVENVNRAPSMGVVAHYTIEENEPLEFVLSGSDPDEDNLTFSVSGLANASINGSIFSWTPSYDSVQNGSVDANVTFTVSDGSLQDSKSATFTILDMNRPPEILSFSPEYSSVKVPRNVPVVFEVLAQDLDGDDLVYTWNFGLFQTVEGKAAHQRRFTEPGVKKVSVTASDGEKEIVQEWNVRVT